MLIEIRKGLIRFLAFILSYDHTGIKLSVSSVHFPSIKGRKPSRFLHVQRQNMDTDGSRVVDLLV